MHKNWFKKVIWLGTSTQNALFHHVYDIVSLYPKICHRWHNIILLIICNSHTHTHTYYMYATSISIRLQSTKKSFVFYCFFVLSLYFLKMKTFADFLNWTRSAEICRFSKIAKNAKSHHPTLPYSVCTYIFRHWGPSKKKTLFLLGWTFFNQV